MHPYTYRYSRIYYHTALAAMVPFVIRLFRDFSYAGLEDALGSALLFAIFFPLFIYFHQLNTSYILEANQLVIRKWLGKNRTYVYTDLRRAIVRKKEEGREEAYTLKLQLSDGKKLKLPLSYLNDREQFVRRLQQRVEQHGHRLLYQNEAGEFHLSLKDLQRQEA